MIPRCYLCVEGGGWIFSLLCMNKNDSSSYWKFEHPPLSSYSFSLKEVLRHLLSNGERPKHGLGSYAEAFAPFDTVM